MTPNASGYNSAEISLDSFTLVIKSYENSYLDMLNLYQHAVNEIFEKQ